MSAKIALFGKLCFAHNLKLIFKGVREGFAAAARVPSVAFTTVKTSSTAVFKFIKTSN
ncbi:MAG TPA: hypothetical protein PLC17_09710 [Tenuifilaceae bacterium]|nr:hypothetical protein [Tenuifilaceae bacterium]HQB77609.1 hypothetical protein [Tenuifilaceae bacterium]